MTDHEKAAFILAELVNDEFNVEIVLEKLVDDPEWRQALWKLITLSYDSTRSQKFGDDTVLLAAGILRKVATDLADDSRYELLESADG